jgi:Glycosyltransferase
LPSVLFIADHLGYPGGVVHGATTYYLDTLPALAAAGVRVVPCFLREYHPAAEELRARGVEPIFLSAARLNPFVVGRVAKIAQTHGCTLIHANNFKSTVVARLLARRLGLPLLVHVHDVKLPPFALRLANRLLAGENDLGLCVSQAVVPVAVGGYAIRPDHAHVVHTGIHLGPYQSLGERARAEMRAELGIGPDEPVLAMVARMYREKGHREMLRIMRSVARVHPDARLLLAGDGPERRACEALARELGVREAVRFLGARRDVARVLAASDVLVVPSQSEGLGRAPIEANLVGLPVVAFATGGLREVIEHPDDGVLVPEGDLDAFARAVSGLLARPTLHDERLRQARAQRAADRFGIDAHVRRLRECYERAAGASIACGGMRSVIHRSCG